MKKQFDGKVIYDEIRSKDHIIYGTKHEGTILQGAKAIVMPGHYIRIYGQSWSRREPVDFDKIFNIGDTAEYDSYNLKYTGKILAIGEKTITIERSDTGHGPCRLSIYSFSLKNWDFDAVKIAKNNFETMVTL